MATVVASRAGRWLPALVAAAIYAGLSVCAAATGERGKDCPGSYPAPVVNLCPERWPAARDTKVWLIVFHGPWCGHCKTLEPKYTELARVLRDDHSIALGALDCTFPEHHELCRKFKVVGYPTLKAIFHGQGKDYEGAREVEAMKDWILRVEEERGTKGGSAKCAAGIFGSGSRSVVVPLCRAHFPQAESKSDWLVVAYDQGSVDAEWLRSTANEAATALGGGSEQQNKKNRRDRLKELARKYGLKVKLPSSGPAGKVALAKVGGVCCDCEDSRAFCRSTLGADVARAISSKGGAAVVWAAGAERTVLVDRFEGSTGALIALALMQLGYVERGSAGQEEL